MEEQGKLSTSIAPNMKQYFYGKWRIAATITLLSL